MAQSDASTIRSNSANTPTQPLLPYNNAYQTTSAPSDAAIVLSNTAKIPTQPLQARQDDIQPDHWLNDANTFDILLQFNQTTMQDLQIRSLNTSLATGLWLKSPLSRLIDHPISPLEIKAHWNKPQVSIQENQVEISAEIKGGAHRTLTGRILTLDGEVNTKQQVVVESDQQGRPYVCLKAPDPLHVHVNNLKVSYEGSTWPSLLAKLDPAREKIMLRPILSQHLMEPLASIPLTFFPHSLPVGMRTESQTSSPILPVTQAVPNIVQKSSSLILGLMLDAAHPAPTIFTTLLPERSQYNAALSISTSGLNTLLAHLCQQGQAIGQMSHFLWGDVIWQWESLSVALHQGMIQLAGILQQRGQRTFIQAGVQCALDKDGLLRCIITASNTDTAISEIVRTSWMTLLHRLLAVPQGKKQAQDPNAHLRLWQCFDLPGTHRGVETVALDLRIVQGQLAVFYHIPQTQNKLKVEIPPEKPTLVIAQKPPIPHQTTKGAPVTVQLEAKILKESTSPYDHVWATGLSSEPKAEHGPGLTLTQIPKPPVKLPRISQSQELTPVHLKVVDMFGQVSEVRGEAKYIPYRQQIGDKQKPLTSVKIPGLIVAAALIIFVLLLLPRLLQTNAAPTPLLDMLNTVDRGQPIDVKGHQFPPLSQVTITLDTPNDPNSKSSSSAWLGTDSNMSASLFRFTQAQPTQADKTWVTVTTDKDGNFHSSVPTNSAWSPLSNHTLYVWEKDGHQPVTHLFSINPLPACISTDQTSLPFTAIQGQQSNLTAQSFTVTNCGGAGTITTSVSTKNGGTWITIHGDDKIGVSGQLPIKVSVNAQGLSVGQYTSTIIVNFKDANGGSTTKQVTVSLTITKQCDINVSSTGPSFTSEQGANSPSSQTFPVVSSCPGTVTTSVSTNNGGSWLRADDGGRVDAANPLKIGVSVNTQGLSAGTYTGSVSVTFNETNGITITRQVSITLVISAPCRITINQTAPTFTAEQGGNNPDTQTYLLTSSCAGSATTNVTTNNGGSWLSADWVGTLTSPGQLPINASVNSQGLTPGQYTGSIIVTFKDTFDVSTPQSINVTLTVTPQCTIAVNPTSLSFTTEQGANNPASQTSNVSTINGCSGKITINTNGTSWLSANGANTLTYPNQLPITVSVNSQHMTQGTYPGSITVTFQDANGVTATQTITVKLTVFQQCTISVKPTSLSFKAEQGGNNPPSQTSTVSTTIPNCSGTVTTKVNGGSWLRAGTDGHLDSQNPLGIPISVDNGGLSANTYQGSVIVTFKDAYGITLTEQIKVQFTVIQKCTISVSPNTLTFTAEQGGKDPAPQTVTVSTVPNCSGTIVTSSSTTLPITITGGGHFAYPDHLTLKVSVNTQSLSAGTYTTSAIVTFNDDYGLSTNQSINITVKVLQCISVSPNTLSFIAEQGGKDPAPQTATVTNSCPITVNWSAHVDQSWLRPFSGNLNANSHTTISVQPSLANLQPGKYTGHIIFGSTSNAPNITVTFDVRPQCTSNNISLDFTAEQGGNNPPSQPVKLTNNCILAVNWSSKTDQSWLTIDHTSGYLNPNATTTINVQPLIAKMTPGTYTAHITTTSTETNGTVVPPATVTVTLTIKGPCLSIYPPSTTFTTTTQFTLTDCGATAGTLKVSVRTNNGGGSWLSATTNPTSINANGGTSILTITVNNQILPAGTYTGRVDIVMTDIYGIPAKAWVDVTYTQYTSPTPTPTPTRTPNPTPTRVPTPTPTPTHVVPTPTPTPTRVPTPTPTPTHVVPTPTPTPTRVPTPTPTPTHVVPTPTPTPTRVPTPTPTHVISTPTPTPTHVPSPTSTPTTYSVVLRQRSLIWIR